MASPHSAALRAFVKRNGPTGDTKYDIFNQSGLSRAKMRKGRTTRKPPVKTYPNYRPTSGHAPGETV